ncbi:MAG: TetR/AcrR family transcriptional regulator [Acidimicrobiales bacterium]
MSTTPSRRTRPRGRPARISQAQIVGAALELGLDSFTMQGIAAHLGVTTPALYSHVAGRDEVVALVNAELLRHMLAFTSDAEDWRGWLTDFAHEVSDTLTASAGTLLVELEGPASSIRVGIGERGNQLLLDAGLTPREAGQVLWLVFRAAITARSSRVADLDRFVDRTGSLFAAGGDDLPATRAVHAAMVADPIDTTLPFDLELVLDGIDARLARRSTP